MELNKYFNKKGQGLPLNTIVIAMLVIIVLVVIILYFTTNMGRAGSQMEENSITKCDNSNVALSTIYEEIAEANEKTGCTKPKERIGTVPAWNKSGTMKICCAERKN